MESFTPPCADCGGRCCRYIAIQIDKPSTKKDYDYIRWYLAHRDVNVFVDHERNWFVEFRTPCEFQDVDKKCMIYNKRPNICRGHGNGEGECEYYDTPYSAYFSDLEEFEKYLDRKKTGWRYKNLK